MKINSKQLSKKFHKLIPGGCHTYSKADNQFPENSPKAIKYGKGAYIFSEQNIRYLDCGMGLSSVSIGHANKSINNAVKKAIDKGVNFNRPSLLELVTADKFLKLIPQHQMIKFAKNGSTVTTAAIKLARAYTKRDYILFPRTHPFYSYDDWFMITKDCNAGIPKSISKFSIQFEQCNIESLKKVFKENYNKIACVIMEPERNYCNVSCDCKIRVDDFLKQAIDLTHKNGALFITDEMVTGFKTHLPGSTVKYNLNADLSTWGKGIANGFSFCALTGKKKIMELGGIKDKKNKRVFLISTTHGAETASLAAVNATIDFFKKKKVIYKNKKLLRMLAIGCNKIIQDLNMSSFIKIIASEWFVSFDFYNNKNEHCFKTKTLIQQEMIKKKILFQGFFVPSYAHNLKDIHNFHLAFKHSLKILNLAQLNGFNKYLNGKIVQPIFSKFNK
jgi:glutamate-1-semialdehyde aminotransferase